MSGFIVNKPQPQSYYNASKAGVHHLTKSLAAEWAERNVRVNAVAPTYIDTPLNRFVQSKPAMLKAWLDGTPMNRLGRCEEIASVSLFWLPMHPVCSPAALSSPTAAILAGEKRAISPRTAPPFSIPAPFFIPAPPSIPAKAGISLLAGASNARTASFFYN